MKVCTNEREQRTICQHHPAAAAKLLQSYPTLCNPIDGSPPCSAVLGILQARTLEWVAISFSSAWKWKVKLKLLGRVQLLATPWTAAHQGPPSMGFSRQEYWSGLPLPSPNIILVKYKICQFHNLLEKLCMIRDTVWGLKYFFLNHICRNNSL